MAGAIGWWVPEALGLGEIPMQSILNPTISASTYGVGILAMLCLAKLLASVLLLNPVGMGLRVGMTQQRSDAAMHVSAPTSSH